MSALHRCQQGHNLENSATMKFSAEGRKLILQIYKYFEGEKKRGAPFYSFSCARKRTAHAFGINEKYLYRLIKEEEKGTNSKPLYENKKKETLDKFDQHIVRTTIQEFYRKNEFMSTRRLKKRLENDHNLHVSKYTILKLLQKFGYRYGECQTFNRAILCERSDLVAQRHQYLRTIKQRRNSGYNIVYLDETWVNANHTASYQWLPPDPKDGRKIPAGRGERLIVLHAGGSMGFLPGCELVFKSLSTDGRDYHKEMNATVFMDWTIKKLIPALPPKSLVVLDNASYHSVRVEGTKTPTSNNRKAEMQEWLVKNNIKFENKMTKPKLYELIKQNKPPPKFKFDELLKEHGHEALRLPPYHCDLNPIELIWGDVKGLVGQENSTFKLKDVQRIVEEALQETTTERWVACVNKVKNEIEEGYWKKDALNVSEEIQPFIIHLESEDEDTDEEELL